jgi:hypothetical protein
VSLLRNKGNKLTAVADQKVPCPSIVLLTTDEDLCLAYCPSCSQHAPYRLNVEILGDTYMSY